MHSTSTASDSETRRSRKPLRVWLGALALAGGWCAIGSSCAQPFDAPSEVNALRVFSVDATKPCPTDDDPNATCGAAYANPGDTITLTMSLVDGLDRQNGRPIQITWLGGCFDPDGDVYFGCYTSLADTLQKIASGALGPDDLTGLAAQGPFLDTFQITLPNDIVTRRDPPVNGPYSGSAFVFFTACAGTVRPIPQEGTSDAGSFPLGCFDDQGNRLGPDSFVAGYTQLYAFDDGRANANPTILSLDLDKTPIPEDTAASPHTKACDLSDEQRSQAGCSAPDEFKECDSYKIKVQVPHDVAEVDPEGQGTEGEQLREVVWVSYFADGGDFDSDTKLISDATKGYQDLQEVEWVPPTDPGTYTLWAVVRDSRGGSSTIKRFVIVDP